MLSELVTVTSLAAHATIVVPHTIGLTPDLILPNCGTPIGAVLCDATCVTFYNYGDTPQSATFVLHRMHSVQGQVHVAATDTETPLLWAGGHPQKDLLWTAIEDVTVANTAAETSMLPALSLGSRTLPPGYWYPGRMLRWETRGHLTTLAGGGETTTFRLYLDGVKIVESVGSMPPGGLTSAYVEAVLDLVCRSVNVGAGTATLYGVGRTLIKTAIGINTVNMRDLETIGGTFSVSNTVSMDFGATYQFANANPGNVLVLSTSDLRSLS